MLFVQVILGGSAVLLNLDIGYHVAWGIATFVVLVATTVFVVRSYGSKSTIFKVSIAAIVDFVVQGILGLFSFSSDTFVVVHLTNAFVLAVIVTYMISFVDSADKNTDVRTTVQPAPV